MIDEPFFQIGVVAILNLVTGAVWNLLGNLAKTCAIFEEKSDQDKVFSLAPRIFADSWVHLVLPSLITLLA